MSNMYYVPFRPAYDSAGISVPGAQHYFTLSDGGTGGEEPSPPFLDAALTTPSENPVVADGAGKLPPIYLDEAIQYRVRIYDRNAEVGVDTPLEDYAPYLPGTAGTEADAGLRSDLAADTGSLLVKHKMEGAGTYGRTVRQWAAVGGMGVHNVFNWVDPDLDEGVLDGSVSDDMVEMVMAGVDHHSTRGGALFFPAGLFLVGAYSGGGVITVPSNVRLLGSGAGSVIKLKTGTNLNLVNIAADAENWEVDHLLLDGNCNGDLNNNAGSTFRSSGAAEGWAHHLWIRDSAAYGMGFEAGATRFLTIDHIDIDGTQADGIDFKNDDDANKNVTLSNIMVRNYARNLLEATQTGIDIRGSAQLSNIWIGTPAADDAVGIRFRQGEVGDLHGPGGHNSNLNNFFIQMTGGANQFGINVVARGVNISNGQIIAARRGLYVQDSGFFGANINVFNSIEYAFYLRATDGTLDADDSYLSQCSAYNGATGFMIDADRCQLSRCYGEGNSAEDVNIAAAANQARISGGAFRSVTPFTLAGTNYDIEGVSGYQLSFTVAQLATALTAPLAGRRAFVSDLSSTTAGDTATGGGAGKAWCTYDGTNWKVGL